MGTADTDMGPRTSRSRVPFLILVGVGQRVRAPHPDVQGSLRLRACVSKSASKAKDAFPVSYQQPPHTYDAMGLRAVRPRASRR